MTELGIGTQSVIQRGAQAMIISADNLVATGFPTIHNAAQAGNIPIFTTETGLVEKGAAGAYG